MQVIDKPWGKEEILAIQNDYVVKRLTMMSGKRCSRQYHKYKTETIYVIRGILRLHIGDDILRLYQGESVTILPGIIHRMEGPNCGGGISVVYLECSTTELDDVIRVEEDYGRE